MKWLSHRPFCATQAIHSFFHLSMDHGLYCAFYYFIGFHTFETKMSAVACVQHEKATGFRYPAALLISVPVVFGPFLRAPRADICPMHTNAPAVVCDMHLALWPKFTVLRHVT